MKKKKLIFLLLSTSTFCFAQIETDPARAIQFEANPKYMSYVFGVGSAYLKNTYASPLAFSGPSVYVGTNSVRYKKRGVLDTFIDISFDIAGQGPLLNLTVKTGYFYHWLLYSDTKLFFYTGLGGSSNTNLMRNTNGFGYNHLSLTEALNVSPSVMLKYRLQLFGQNFDLSQQIYTPFIGCGVYPRYSYLGYNSQSDSKILFTLILTSLHNSWGLNGRTYIDWRQKDKKGEEKKTFLRFGYQYEGSRVNFDGNSFQMSKGHFFVGTIKKF